MLLHLPGALPVQLKFSLLSGVSSSRSFSSPLISLCHPRTPPPCRALRVPLPKQQQAPVKYEYRVEHGRSHRSASEKAPYPACLRYAHEDPGELAKEVVAERLQERRPSPEEKR